MAHVKRSDDKPKKEDKPAAKPADKNTGKKEDK